MSESTMQILGCLIGIFLANTGIFLWLRMESRADHRQCIDLIMAIQAEIKDFHGRLCAIEEKRKG